MCVAIGKLSMVDYYFNKLFLTDYTYLFMFFGINTTMSASGKAGSIIVAIIAAIVIIAIVIFLVNVLAPIIVGIIIIIIIAAVAYWVYQKMRRSS
jgi:Flp pilus assembly protein TadB